MREVRAYWGTRYLDHARRDLEGMAGQGVEVVVHGVTEEDLLHRRRAVERLLHATRALGLGCWTTPWGVGGAFAGPGFGSGAPAGRTVAAWLTFVAACGAEGVVWDDPVRLAPTAGWVADAGVLGMRSSVALSGDGDRAARASGIPGLHDLGLHACARTAEAAALRVRALTLAHGITCHLQAAPPDMPAARDAARRHGVDAVARWPARGPGDGA